MASIYESPGQQVALTGSQTGVSFQPVQAYDPSRMMLAQSEKDLNAFAQFSDTLTKFITEKAQEKNKADYLRGLAGLGNKETSLKPEFIQDQRVKAEVLRQGAEEEINVANSIAKTDPIQAERYYSRAPARSGWEAYGAAVREARIIAGQSRSFFSQFYRSNDPKDAIQIPGTGKTITPAQATTEEELAAIDAAAGVAFMARNKLDVFNPAIIAEFVLPTMDEGRSDALATRTREMLANNQELKLAALDVSISRGVRTFSTKEEVETNVRGFFDAAFGITRNWKEANEWVSDNLRKSLQKLTIEDPRGAPDIITMYENAPISNDPNLGTLGERFEEVFIGLKNLSDSTNEKLDAQNKEQAAQSLKEILSVVDLAQQTGDLGQAERSWDAAEKQILALSKQYPVEAMAALGELKAKERSYSVKDEKNIIATIKDPDELLALRLYGRLSDDGYKLALENVPSSSGKAKISAVGKDYLNVFASQIAEELKGQGINDPENARNLAMPFARQLVNELMVELSAEEARLRAEGRTLTEGEIRDRIAQRGDDKLKNNSRFQIKVEDGKLVTKVSAAESVKFESGRTIQDLVKTATAKLPRIASSFSPGLSKEALVNNIEAISSGGKPDERVNVLAAAANTDPIRFLEIQGSLPENKGVNISGLRNSNAAKAFQENYKISPRDALILTNPRNTALQRQQARQNIENIKRQQMLSQQQTGPTLETLRTSLIQKEGGRNLYSGANRGTPGDTPSGVPNLENMTIAQVKQLYRQGYNALGAYQFIGTTLPIVQAVAGISDSAKFNKETQDKLFEAVLFKGANNRTRLSNYLNGRSNDLQGAVNDFSLEFASAFGAGGRGQYNGISDNRASLDVTQMLRSIREERMGRGQPVDMSRNNIISINMEEPGKDKFQPGFDLGFKDFRFGAVLPGRVKEIRRNAGNYGNMIIVESTDPVTGENLDVVYAHLGSISVSPNQSIKAGQFIGMEGGTGRVKSSSGTIASVDFLAPAPVGSNNMTPYRNWRELRQRLVQQINSGGIF